jgi:N-carbamoyl-L-amino-acid hydrolase
VRFSWTAVDRQLRDWFTEQAEARHLKVEADRNGNLWATLGDADLGEIVATGSHLDSVPNGGAFDGPLGIASAFAALDLLADRGLRPLRPVAIVAFAEEEGARFGMACLGSRLSTGAIERERARVLIDAEGITLAEAFADAGSDPNLIGPDVERLSRLAYLVELHIEQGRVLADLESPIGVASEIWPHGRWRLDFRGRADHAGTTRMEDRIDPMVAFASAVIRVTDEAGRLGARSTFGQMRVTPNATNAIPSHVTTWLDGRAADQRTLELLVASIDPGPTVTNESFTARVEFDIDLCERTVALLDRPPVLATAAGHDAGIIASAGIPTAMIFVRNQTGISHSPDEYATPEDCDTGVEALATVLADLAGFK